MSTRQGYGINGENILWIDNISDVLYKRIKVSDTQLKNELEQYEMAHSEYDLEDMFDMFCEEYENPSYGWWGLDGVVTDYIDELAFDGRNLLRYEDGCYYIDAVDALEAEISLDEIRNKLVEFFFPFCQEEPKIGWYDIHFD